MRLECFFVVSNTITIVVNQLIDNSSQLKLQEVGNQDCSCEPTIGGRARLWFPGAMLCAGGLGLLVVLKRIAMLKSKPHNIKT